MERTPLSPRPMVYAHRGDRSRADDNTIEAYKLAVEAGTDGIELDVRRTRDDVLIVSHDDHAAGLPPFSELAFSELRERAPLVPTLREAMDTIPASVFVNVEIKNFTFDAGYDESRAIVNATLDELSHYDRLDRILMSSFDVMSMKRVRDLDRTLLCGQLLLQVFPLEAGITIANELALDAVVPHLDHVKEDAIGLVDTIRSNGLATVVWGVNTPEDVSLVATAGVEALITDDPAMARSVVGQL